MLVSLALSLPSCEMRGFGVKSDLKRRIGQSWNLRVQGAITTYKGSLLFKIGRGLDSR
jgi:hypothetical protein